MECSLLTGHGIAALPPVLHIQNDRQLAANILAVLLFSGAFMKQQCKDKGDILFFMQLFKNTVFKRGPKAAIDLCAELTAQLNQF